jgi:6-phosphogluconolactonase (cycloisomerase 2 family)
MKLRLLIAGAVVAAVTAAAPAVASAAPFTGTAFTETNATSGNTVLAYVRDTHGHLHHVWSVATGGTGTGANLGSEGAVALGSQGRRLYAVNAGSNTVTVFGVLGAFAWRQAVVPSGGTQPISVAVGPGTVYVLNAGGTPNVAAFRITRRGLHPLANGVTPLGAGDSGPAQVAVDPVAGVAVVTNKNSNTIDTFAIGPSGRLGAANSQASAGATPFGFAFTPLGTLVVSDAGEAPTSAATAYHVSSAGALSVASGPLQTHQLAACWVATTPDGRFAYVADAHSGTISAMRVTVHGTLSLLDPSGISASGGAGSTTLDESVTPGGRFLSVVVDNAKPGVNGIATFAIGRDGSLQRVGFTPGLAASDVGLVTG